METREYRFDVAMMSTINEGDYFYEGTVANVSSNGLKMTGLPAKFNAQAPKCNAIISDSKHNYKLVIRPSWHESNGMYQEVGFRILNYSTDWLYLLKSLEPKPQGYWDNWR